MKESKAKRTGRNPLPKKEKKEQVQFYTPFANIQRFGGKAGANKKAKILFEESINGKLG